MKHSAGPKSPATETPVTAAPKAAHPAPELSGYDLISRTARARMAGLTMGIAPSALSEAFEDWAKHLVAAPGKRLELAHLAYLDAVSLAGYAARCGGKNAPESCIQPQPQDSRFEGEAWRKWPFNLMAQSFLAQEKWWHTAMTGIPGVTDAHANVADFVTRQMLDMMAPANFPLTNPEVLTATFAQGGQNLVRGGALLAADVLRNLRHEKPPEVEAFQVGRDLAVTPGKVVFRNRLIELIQYAPTTDTVQPEPVLIVPAWIMKYYILDLSPQNSFVKFLVGQGFTVYMISWLNPGKADRNLSMEDYRSLGVMAATDAVERITGADRIHAVGYCLGGTLLSIAAAAMGRDGDERFKTLTLLAAQTDFTEAGELTLFINEAQVTYLEDMMWKQGYLSTEQMGGAFRLLRSADLIWSKNVHDYLMGELVRMFDLLAWNADGTRLPATMHSQYLRWLFLNNDLAAEHYHVGDRPVTVSNIGAPMFVVGTEDDHVAPWKSVYKIHLMADTDVTFVLTSGGHNAGIVSEPGHAHRHFRMATTKANAAFVEDHDWMDATPAQEGSWWLALSDWLKARSGAPVTPPPMGAKGEKPLCDAPGTYVLQP
ncbi:MAG: PHA/PHB synthase family protein [Cypionkella sp.]